MKENKQFKATVNKMTRENQKTSQMLKDANKLNGVLTEQQRLHNYHRSEYTRFAKVQKERDDLAARYVHMI